MNNKSGRNANGYILWPSLIGVFLCSQAVIHLELLLIRATSVILWHHYTSLVISFALVGFGTSGIFLAYLTRHFKHDPSESKKRHFLDEHLKEKLSVLLSLLFAICIPVSFLIFTHTPLLSTAQEGLPIAFFYWVLILLALSVPFFLGGSLIGLWIVFSPKDVGKYYGVNLLGSAIGSLSYFVAISSLGASGSIFFISCIVLAGALSFSVINRGKWYWILSSIFLVLGVILIFFAEGLLPVRAPAGKRAFNVSPEKISYTGWNAISRIDVMDPSYSGPSSLTVLFDGGTATTYIPQIPNTLQQENPDIVRSGNPLIHRIIKEPNVLVVGSGGGVDVRDFLVNGARKVTAVEINPLINRLVKEEFSDVTGDLYRDERVVVVSGDGRNFLARTDEKFDIIHLGLPITNTALSSGALNLAEDSLLTREAFASYIDHLTPGGMIYMLHDEIAALRAVATEEAVFEQKKKMNFPASFVVLMQPFRGIDSLPISQGRTELFLKNGVFTKEELDLIKAFAYKYHRVIRYMPGRKGDTYFHRFVSRRLTDESIGPFPEIIHPTTDNKPFFNHLVKWPDFARLVFTPTSESRFFQHRTLTAERILLMTFIILISFVSIVFVVGSTVLHKDPLRSQIYPYMWTSFFTGFGFILAELAFLSLIRMLWGHPETAAMYVLAGLLVSAGIGSLCVERLSGKFKWFIVAALSALVLLLAFSSLSLPRIIAEIFSLEWKIKAVVVMFFMGSTGFLLGIPFTWTLRELSKLSQFWVGWAWTVNIFSSAIGAILGFMIAIDLGYSIILLLASFCYLIVIFIFKYQKRFAA